MTAKLIWLEKAFVTMLSGFVAPLDGLKFVLSRYLPGMYPVSMRDVDFGKLDRGLWRQLFHIFLRREYSPPGFEIDENDLVLDIGANRGVFTAYAASQTSAPVHAYEPDPTNYSKLTELMRGNDFANVHLHQCAVSAKNGMIQLFQSAADTRHSLTGVDVLTGEQLETFVEVPSVNLDSVIAKFDEVDLLKMDCEGAEFEIFGAANAESLLKIRRIVLEYHSRRDDPRLNSLLNLLTQSGFEVSIVGINNSNRGMVFAKQKN